MNNLINHIIATHNMTITQTEDNDIRECYTMDPKQAGISFILLKKRQAPWGPTLIINLRKGVSTAKRLCEAEQESVNLNDPTHVEQALRITEDYLIRLG